jgi:hypothetical protein
VLLPYDDLLFNPLIRKHIYLDLIIFPKRIFGCYMVPLFPCHACAFVIFLGFNLISQLGLAHKNNKDTT